MIYAIFAKIISIFMEFTKVKIFGEYAQTCTVGLQATGTHVGSAWKMRYSNPW